MVTKGKDRVRVRAPAAGRFGRLASLVALALVAIACIAPEVSAGGLQQAGQGRIVQSSRGRWWLDTYAHSMQEQLFIAWMDAWYGLPIWRHSMQERDVNALYAWWTATYWIPLENDSAD